MVTQANGTAERRASEIMLKAQSKAADRRITAGADKAYDTADHVAIDASNQGYLIRFVVASAPLPRARVFVWRAGGVVGQFWKLSFALGLPIKGGWTNQAIEIATRGHASRAHHAVPQILSRQIKSESIPSKRDSIPRY
jgi:hypothetical protein